MWWHVLDSQLFSFFHFVRRLAQFGEEKDGPVSRMYTFLDGRPLRPWPTCAAPVSQGESLLTFAPQRRNAQIQYNAARRNGETNTAPPWLLVFIPNDGVCISLYIYIYIYTWYPPQKKTYVHITFAGICNILCLFWVAF